MEQTPSRIKVLSPGMVALLLYEAKLSKSHESKQRKKSKFYF